LAESKKACKEVQAGSCCVTVSNITISYARLVLASRTVPSFTTLRQSRFLQFWSGQIKS
jgi:hypothetical protein